MVRGPPPPQWRGSGEATFAMARGMRPHPVTLPPLAQLARKAAFAYSDLRIREHAVGPDPSPLHRSFAADIDDLERCSSIGSREGPRHFMNAALSCQQTD